MAAKTSTMLRRGGPFRHMLAMAREPRRGHRVIAPNGWRCLYCDLTYRQIHTREGYESNWSAAELPMCTRVLAFPGGDLELPTVVVEWYGDGHYREFVRHTTDGLHFPAYPTPDWPTPPPATF